MTDETNVTDDLSAFEAELFQAGETKEVPPGDDAPAPEQEETAEPAPTEEPEGEQEEIDENETDDGDEPEEDSAFKVKGRRKSARERINELTAKAREAERRVEELERRLTERAEKPAEKVETTPEPLKTVEGAPNPDDVLEDGAPKYPLGEFDPEFIRDMTKFTIAAEMKAAKEAEEQSRKETELRAAEEKLHTEWQEKVTKAEEHLPELRERAATLETTFRDLDPNYGKYLASTIMSMEFGPEVLDYLGGNLAEAQEIVASGPTAATIALGRLEAKFALAKERSDEKRGRQTSAPPPPPHVSRGSGGKFAVRPDTDDLDAFERELFKK